MKKFFYQICFGTACLVLIPIIFTLLIQGGGKNYIKNSTAEQGMETEQASFTEEMLPGIIANEISMESEIEAMKAQAVIARTNCLRAMATGEEFPEGITKSEMIRLWGKENFSDYYSQLESCIEATKGIAMMYDGNYIQADYHTASAGYTRNASEVYGNSEYPYLKSVDCRIDIPSEDFLKVNFYTPEEFLQQGQKFYGEDAKEKSAADIIAGFVITKQDTAGYVTEVTIDGNSYSGEEVRLAYDWNSSCFSIKEVDGQIRIVTKGCGHGLGVSLYGANVLAAKGDSYKDILKYFYSEIEFVTQYD